MAWRVAFSGSAHKDLRALQPQLQSRIVIAVNRLAEDPLAAAGVTKLSERDDYRLRVGDYRVIYDLEHGVLTVHVISVAHRREAYR